MKRNWIITNRTAYLLLTLAVTGVFGATTKNVDQLGSSILTINDLPQVAEILNAATYLEDFDDVEKNYDGSRKSLKRLPRKLQTSSITDQQAYQGVMGRPGVDFPILSSIPTTEFSCKKVKKPGYYADLETDCQVFHICENGRKVSFLCPNGTIFRQSHLICDWWFRVDCERSVELYEESAEQLAFDQRAVKDRSEALNKSTLKVQSTKSVNSFTPTQSSPIRSSSLFNSESNLPNRAKYYGESTKDENQVPAESGSIIGDNNYQTSFNNLYSHPKFPLRNWFSNANIQTNNYQVQSSANSQPFNKLNQYNSLNSNNYQFTSIQPIWNQNSNNNYQTINYQSQSTSTPSSWNQKFNSEYPVLNYQKLSTTTSQPNWNQGNNNDYQKLSTTTQPSWNKGFSNNFASSNYQTQPTTVQTFWNQNTNNNYQYSLQQIPQTTPNPSGVISSNNNFQTINDYNQLSTTTLKPIVNTGNTNYQLPYNSYPSSTQVILNQGNFQSSNQYQSTTTPSQGTWNQDSSSAHLNNNYQPSTLPISQGNWEQGVTNAQSSQYQPSSTIQSERNQDTSTVQTTYLTDSYPKTTLSSSDESKTLLPQEYQQPAESSSFLKNQNTDQSLFSPQNYFTQTNPSVTTDYPTTFQYESTVGTTIYNYRTMYNSTGSLARETLAPIVVNSFTTLTDNNLNSNEDMHNVYPQVRNTEQEQTSLASYSNDDKDSVQSTTIGNEAQSTIYADHTTKTFVNEPEKTNSDETIEEATTPVDNLQLPVILTQNTKEAYDKLFQNKTKEESVDVKLGLNATLNNMPDATKSVNNFAQNLVLNRSSAELRELAAVFTRALTAYLDDPENFRKILSEVRPTEPPSVKPNTIEDQEVLDFSDDSKNLRSKKPEITTVSSSISFPISPSSTPLNLAAEVNGITQDHTTLADLSTIVPQYTTSPLVDIISSHTDTTATGGVQDYAPLADSEQLQTAGSQSFFTSRDNTIVGVAKPLSSVVNSLAWTVPPNLDSSDQDIRFNTQQPVYFTTPPFETETPELMEKAKDMFNYLNDTEAGILINVMKTAQTNDTIKRLVLLLVNDPNKDNDPEQTRHNIIDALLENKSTESYYFTTTPLPETSYPTPSLSSSIPFGQRLEGDGSPVQNGHDRKARKGTRRRVVYRNKVTSSTTSAKTPEAETSWQGANDIGPGLSEESDARAVELLKSLYSIASNEP